MGRGLGALEHLSVLVTIWRMGWGRVQTGEAAGLMDDTQPLAGEGQEGFRPPLLS